MGSRKLPPSARRGGTLAAAHPPGLHASARPAGAIAPSPLAASARTENLIVGGVDPGTRQVGYAILCASGGRWQVRACGSIACGRGIMAERLARIAVELEALFTEHRPVRVGIETTYYGRSAGAAIKMGQGRGVAMAAAARLGAEVVEIAPRSIKQAVTGNGGASKDQVAAMAVSLLGLVRRPKSSDASDALGCALAVAMLSEGIPISRDGRGARLAAGASAASAGGAAGGPGGAGGTAAGGRVRRPGRKLGDSRV